MGTCGSAEPRAPLHVLPVFCSHVCVLFGAAWYSAIRFLLWSSVARNTSRNTTHIYIWPPIFEGSYEEQETEARLCDPKQEEQFLSAHREWYSSTLCWCIHVLTFSFVYFLASIFVVCLVKERVPFTPLLKQESSPSWSMSEWIIVACYRCVFLLLSLAFLEHLLFVVVFLLTFLIWNDLELKGHATNVDPRINS